MLLVILGALLFIGGGSALVFGIALAVDARLDRRRSLPAPPAGDPVDDAYLTAAAALQPDLSPGDVIADQAERYLAGLVAAHGVAGVQRMAGLTTSSRRRRPRRRRPATRKERTR